MLIGPIYYIIRPSVCVLRCDIALTGLGYITSSVTKFRPYIGPVNILYILNIYIIYSNRSYIQNI